MENSLDQSIPKSLQISNQEVLQYIWAVICKFRASNEQNSIECILCEQKLIHLSLLVMEKERFEVEYQLVGEVVNLVKKINLLAMEGIKLDSSSNVKFISKAVDIVMLPDINKYITDEVALTKLKILTFNNFACILKRQKHLMMALKAVSFAITLQQGFIQHNIGQERYDIVPTYLNKAAILSDMKKHQRALEEIRKANVYVQGIEQQVQLNIKNCIDSELLKRYQQKRHYGMYMKMLINYNIGVQKQHQKLISSAVNYYKEGKRLAKQIDNKMMVQKLQEIISNLKSN